MCDLETIQANLCTSGIGKVNNPITLKQIIAQLLCNSIGPPVPIPFAYEPTSAIVTWTDTNGAGQSGNLAAFNSTADLPTVSAISLQYQSLTALTVGNQMPLLTQMDASYNSLTNINLEGCSLTNLDLAYNLFVALDVTDALSLVLLDVSYVTTLTSVNFSGLASFSIFRAGACTGLTSVDSFLAGCPALTQLRIGGSGITSLDCSLATTLVEVIVRNTPCTTVVLGANSSLLHFDGINSQITNTDSILATINGYGTSGGLIELYGASVTPPTGGGANPDVVALGLRGWTVFV